MGYGFPSVKLLGKKSDWEAIAARIGKLDRYGQETSEWGHLLLPIANHIVQTFEQPKAPEIKDFWLRIYYKAGSNGSGYYATISGWITAFCFWNEEGKRSHFFTDEDLERESYFSKIPVKDRRRLVLDYVPYPIMSPSSIPSALISVPITVKTVVESTTVKTTVIAGHADMSATNNASTVQPLSGWWMLEDSVENDVIVERNSGFVDLDK